ncbi:hypothetical protein [Halobaculum saliterrae]|uniref:hypothetical protein n=1 Tax=Halobaculum saliterrae TaxID=2073113 RepID=UPI0013591774|nr:hypothetical protein [Halobaculum saliterrae]
MTCTARDRLLGSSVVARGSDGSFYILIDDDLSLVVLWLESCLLSNIVTPIPEDQVLVREPSGNTFDSTTQLAVFHRGWTAGRDADAEGE